MLLYHFTPESQLPPILDEGLRFGDVPVNGFHAPGENAVWLTSSPADDDHGLGEPREVTEAERLHYLQWKGVEVPAGTLWTDKREARITVKIPSSDRALNRFLPWARRRFDPEVLDILIRSGGGKRCADTWWLYFGVVEPAAIVEVVTRDESGNWCRLQDSNL